jgi:hypothetical protein
VGKILAGLIALSGIYQALQSMPEICKQPLSLENACIDCSYKNPKLILPLFKESPNHPLCKAVFNRYAFLIAHEKDLNIVSNLLMPAIFDEEKISFLAGIALFNNEKTSFAIKKKFFDSIKQRFTKDTEAASIFSQLDTFFSDKSLEPIGFNVFTSQRLYKKQTTAFSRLFSKKYTAEPLLYHILTVGCGLVARYILQYYPTIAPLMVTDFKECDKKLVSTRSFSVSPYSIPVSTGNTDILCALNAHARKNNDTIITKKVDIYGNYLVHYAAKRAGMKVMSCLLECGASVNQLNKEGETPLHSAVNAQNFESVKALLYCGSDVHAVDKNGQTPLFKAVNTGNATIVRYLIENGCKDDIHYVNNTCTISPMGQALLKNDKTLYWLLQELCECQDCADSYSLIETI